MRTMLMGDKMHEISRRGGRAARVMMDITKFYLDFYNKSAGREIGAGMHDPLAVAVAEDPTLVTKKSMLIDLELSGALTRGQIVADRRRGAEGRENMEICLDVDVERFIDRFTETLVTLGA